MPFVVTEGQLAAVSSAPLPAFPISTRQLDGPPYHEYAEIWRANQQVRTVVGFLARNIAQLGLHVFRRVSETDRERLNDHPLAVLLKNPMPKMTRYRLIERLVSDLGIYDEAFWIKVRADDRLSLVPMPPTRIQILGTNLFYPEGYRIAGARGTRDLSPDEVVHFHGYEPEQLLTGLSPMETLRSLLAEEWEANQHRRQMWRNGGRMTGFISRPANGPKWSKEARERFKQEFKSAYTGDGPDAGGTPILEDGMTYTQAGLDPRAAQYIEARKLTREEVAAAYHIPLPLVGILDHATFSNIREQHKQLYQDTLGPWLTSIAEDIDLQLVPDLPDTKNVYVEFNIQEKLRGSFEEQAAAASTSTGRPWMTVNEQRARLNMPRIEGGDDLVVPLNVLVGGQASPRDSAPDPGSSTFEASATAQIKALESRVRKGARQRRTKRSVLIKARASQDQEDEHVALFRRYFSRQHTAVRSRLGAKSVHAKASLADVWDAERWNRELAADLLELALKVAAYIADVVLRALGVSPSVYNAERTVPFLTVLTTRVAESINAVTERELAAALDDEDPFEAVEHLFDLADTVRAPQLAVTAVTNVSGWASIESTNQELERRREERARELDAENEATNVTDEDWFNPGTSFDPDDDNLVGTVFVPDEDDQPQVEVDVESDDEPDDVLEELDEESGPDEVGPELNDEDVDEPSDEFDDEEFEDTATKTWIVTSNNPRPSHLAMNGQTVDIDDAFSNGARWPADHHLHVDEIAGCKCELLITIS